MQICIIKLLNSKTVTLLSLLQYANTLAYAGFINLLLISSYNQDSSQNSSSYPRANSTISCTLSKKKVLYRAVKRFHALKRSQSKRGSIKKKPSRGFVSFGFFVLVWWTRAASHSSHPIKESVDQFMPVLSLPVHCAGLISGLIRNKTPQRAGELCPEIK